MFHQVCVAASRASEGSLRNQLTSLREQAERQHEAAPVGDNSSPEEVLNNSRTPLAMASCVIFDQCMRDRAKEDSTRREYSTRREKAEGVLITCVCS